MSASGQVSDILNFNYANMQKITFIVSLFLAGMFFAIPTHAEEISDLNAEIRINYDGTIDVKEHILYDFGAVDRHGIYREIPYKYEARGGSFSLRFSNFRVTDDMNREWPFTVDKENGYYRLKIGEADRFVRGQQKYNIAYQVERALIYGEDSDELYWNVSGHGWEVLIRQARAEVYFPENFPEATLEKACFSGPAGTANNCVSGRFIYQNKVDPAGVSFSSDKLPPGSGFTVAVKFPAGVVDKPSILAAIWYVIRDNWILALPFVVIFLMYRLWLKKGKDPIGRQTIVAQYEQPDNLSPALVGTLVDEQADNVDISAELIHLAVNGYLKIEKELKSGLLKSYDYKFTLTKPSGTLPFKYQRDLLDRMFGSKKEVKLSDLKNEFYKDLAKIKKEIYEQVVANEYFPENPNKVRGMYLVIGVFIVILSWFMGPIFDWFGVASFVASGLVVLVFSFIMPKKTKKGVRALEHIKGFKEYLNVAEKDRLDFHNAPEKDPATFEKFLPFAMALKVEENWAKQFDDIYKQQPEWYRDPGTSAFIATDLTRSLASFSSKANSSLASTPSSAASGGSGFSGGGVGGGFGGGGGGSW